MKKSIIAAAILSSAALITAPVHAGGLLGGLGRAIGNAVGGNVGAAITNVSNAGDNASRNLQQGNIGGTLQETGQMIIGAGQVQSGAIMDVGQATGNRDLRNASNAVASVVTINSDALGTATIVSGNVLAGQDARQIYAAPLATAIRQARNAHMHGSQPIPEAIRDALRGTIPDAILDSARYTEGDLEISIANVLNRSNRAFGDDHAVTLGDLIVFTDVPSDDPDDENALHWWAHELTHVWQYRRWGIEQFALNYIDDYAFVEDDADHIADVGIERYASN